MDHRLEEVERAFRDWRRDKPTRAIPEKLWAQAVGVAHRHGVTRTASRLRLNQTRLKERFEREQGGQHEVQGTGFVELAASELLASESVIEIEDGSGIRLRLMLRGAPITTVTAAAKELWSATR